eukprot:TRINITY_DN64967_c0_g1_i1.p3 TRINITY_DN64967_c0_g1~~TRINITY_DN64967_c0_g1_i1.p3  ORF type:complete len:205 (+),score=15.53 TRINITY_DN64967_c0_g1_i1:292-906(+)
MKFLSRFPFAQQQKTQADPKENKYEEYSDDSELDDQEDMDPERKLKLLKNRESASKSRKKKKAMFESLKTDIATLSAERDNIRTQVHKYIELLEKTYAENEALRTHIDDVLDENSKLKDSILQMQQMLSQSQQSIYAIMLQQKSGTTGVLPVSSPIVSMPAMSQPPMTHGMINPAPQDNQGKQQLISMVSNDNIIILQITSSHC